ncbi:hypothetical protein ACFV98_19735 [Streptomyces violascens]|uniref:hypothetical protein n=1 Tax=Streptomyces violascens TaxID=67381 RepID=UPI0036661F57
MDSPYTRGAGRTVSRQWTIERGSSGRLEAMETFHFDSAQMREPLRDTAPRSGWTWVAVVFRKL